MVGNLCKGKKMASHHHPYNSRYYHDVYEIYELLDNTTGGGDDHHATTTTSLLDVTAMQELFERRPMEVQRTTFVYGQTLFHKFCVSTYVSYRRDIGDLLLNRYPDALQKEDDNGLLPIHYLLSPKSRWYNNNSNNNNNSKNDNYVKEFLHKMLMAYPDSIVATTSIGGQLPLHLLCQRTAREVENNNHNNIYCDKNEITNDDESTTTTEESSSSLTLTFLLIELIDYVINCYPEGCYCKDNYGKYPFDYALESMENNYYYSSNSNTNIHNKQLQEQMAAGIQILQLLIQHNPVLLALSSSLSIDSDITIKSSNDNYNNTLNDSRNDEYYKNSTISTTAYCAGSGSCNNRGGANTGSGDLPLHRIIKKCSWLHKRTDQYDSIINSLADGYQGCLLIQDTSFRSPLQLACTMDNPLSHVYSLLRKFPEQVGRKSNIIFDDTSFNGQLLYPSLIGKLSSVQVQKWMEYNPGIQLIQDIHGRLPIHYAVLSKSKDAYRIVEQLLFPNTGINNNNDTYTAIQQLSTADKSGRLPIHTASASPPTTATTTGRILQLLIDTYPDGLLHRDIDKRLPWHFGECSRQDVVFEKTVSLFPQTDCCDLDLVPDEIRWDILSVNGH